MNRMFEFGPLERGGIFAGITPKQTIAAAITIVVSFIAVTSVRDGLNLLVAGSLLTLGAVMTLFPVNGRPIVEWSDVAVRHLFRRLTGRTAYRTQAIAMGHVQSLGDERAEIEAPVSLPEELASVRILGLPAQGGGEAGVAYDEAAGAYTATLVVTSQQFALLDEKDQLAKTAGWAAVLSGFARDASPVSRLQWTERTLPANTEAMIEYLENNRDPAIADDDPLLDSYRELQVRAASVQQEHELLVTLRIDTSNRQARKLAKSLGRGRDGFCALLLREITSLSRALADAGVEVQGILTPRALALRIREGSNPFARVRRRVDGIHGAYIGPMASKATWSRYEADGTLSRTYWMSEWPRVGVSATFLSPLMLNTEATRAVGLTMEPVPPLKAIRKVQHDATAVEGELDLKAEKRYRISRSDRKRMAAIDNREAQLADGHAEIRFSGFVTVSARSEEELERACSDVEQAAGQSRIELCPLDGEQDRAITFTMPLARGLNSGVL